MKQLTMRDFESWQFDREQGNAGAGGGHSSSSGMKKLAGTADSIDSSSAVSPPSAYDDWDNM